ncbi:hypothetical protein BGW80DRAFT_1461376 [Lactifluus volemus]|nr:hypothetical protein BGW80DRAFT_1461376 [Lactifluus volemus]
MFSRLPYDPLPRPVSVPTLVFRHYLCLRAPFSRAFSVAAIAPSHASHLRTLLSPRPLVPPPSLGAIVATPPPRRYHCHGLQSIGVTVVRASLLRPSEPLTPVTRAMACAGPLHSVSHLPSPPSPAAIPNVAVAVPTQSLPSLLLPRCRRHCLAVAAASLPSLLLPRRRRHCPAAPAVAAAAPTPPSLPRHPPAAAPTPPLRRHPAAPPSQPPYG